MKKLFVLIKNNHKQNVKNELKAKMMDKTVNANLAVQLSVLTTISLDLFGPYMNNFQYIKFTGFKSQNVTLQNGFKTIKQLQRDPTNSL